jgi:hypothetical protein
MRSQGLIFERRASHRSATLQRICAALLCLMLLYFAGGGRFLHEHNGAPDTVCHVCQSLHVPALTIAFSGIAAAPQLAGWHDSRSVITAALDEVSLLRSGRAPPTA